MSQNQPQKLSIPTLLPKITNFWSPKLVAKLNGEYDVKVAKLKGDYVFHAHPETDELFYVLEGGMNMKLMEPGIQEGLNDIEVSREPHLVLFISISRFGVLTNSS